MIPRVITSMAQSHNTKKARSAAAEIIADQIECSNLEVRQKPPSRGGTARHEGRRRCTWARSSWRLSWPHRGAAGERLVGRARVTDGDTLKVGGVAVRLKGLAAPEVAHGGDLGEPGGIEAKAFMVDLVEGQTEICDLTQERTHGRCVGWCYLDGQDVAEALVSAGLARDCPRFSGGQYAAAETAEARDPLVARASRRAHR